MAKRLEPLTYRESSKIIDFHQNPLIFIENQYFPYSDVEKISKFKSTYLGEFLMDFKNFDIFEQEIIPSRA